MYSDLPFTSYGDVVVDNLLCGRYRTFPSLCSVGCRGSFLVQHRLSLSTAMARPKGKDRKQRHVGREKKKPQVQDYIDVKSGILQYLNAIGGEPDTTAMDAVAGEVVENIYSGQHQATRTREFWQALGHQLLVTHPGLVEVLVKKRTASDDEEIYHGPLGESDSDNCQPETIGASYSKGQALPEGPGNVPGSVANEGFAQPPSEQDKLPNSTCICSKEKIFRAESGDRCSGKHGVTRQFLQSAFPEASPSASNLCNQPVSSLASAHYAEICSPGDILDPEAVAHQLAEMLQLCNPAHPALTDLDPYLSRGGDQQLPP